MSAPTFHLTRMTAAEYAAYMASQAPKSKGKAPLQKAQIQLKDKAKSGPNANEKRLLQWIKPQHPKCQFLYESITLRLPSGTNYTPDWVVVCKNHIVALYEAKDTYQGKSARDSKAKFKEARATFPHWRFVFAQWNGETYLTAE